LFYSIDSALESNVFDNVTVSTESEEITQVVKEQYSTKEVNILNRPVELAGDDSNLLYTIEHYLHNSPEIDYVGVFLPTYPFRKIDRIIEIANHIRSRYPWRVTSLTQERYWTRDFFYPKKIDGKEVGVKYTFRKLATFHCPAASSAYTFYDRYFVGDYFYRCTFRSPEEREMKVVVSLKENCDIDTNEDFMLAEQLAIGKKMKTRKLEEHEYNNWRIITPEGVNLKRLTDFVGKEKLDDTSSPILFLEKARYGATSLITTDVSSMFMYSNNEALTSVSSNKMVSTGNSIYKPKDFMHSPYYRFFRMPDSQRHYYCSVVGNFDHHGANFGTVSGDSNGQFENIASDILPLDRVIFMEELKKQAFYIDPIYLV
jgi:hypothetical protein